jgi:membrane-associated protease RseP (regulator of RpoE activity)
MINAPGDAVLAAVLCALAGVRIGDRVAVVGTNSQTSAALLAGCGGNRFVERDADVAVAGTAPDVAGALARLRPGGRIVALAADAGAAQRVAASAGLQLRYVEPVGRLVAWSAARPLDA